MNVDTLIQLLTKLYGGPNGKAIPCHFWQAAAIGFQGDIGGGAGSA
jgi:hypothetical protein